MSKTTRKIMVCVSGMSPAVITETLYALVTEKEFVPDEIHVITTAEGKTKIEEKLLQEGNGWFHRFMNEYLPNEQIRFDTGTIHLISKDGNTLKDITTDEENRAAADTIYRVLRQIKSQAGTQMHVSIAGGRKSMGFYMGHAFSLVADEADTLSHVLVSHPFENPKLDFYYPPKDAKEYLLEGKVWNSTMAKVSLAEVTALKLGKLFENKVLPEDAKTSFEFAVHIMQATLISPDIEVCFEDGKTYLKILGKEIKLSGTEFMVFLIHSLARKQSDHLQFLGGLALDEITQPQKAMLLDIAKEFGLITVDKIANRDIKSDIKRKMENKIGAAAHWFFIEGSAPEGQKKMYSLYTFKVPVDRIKISVTETLLAKVKKFVIEHDQNLTKGGRKKLN